VPGLSTTKVGLTRVGLTRVAVLPVGTVVNAHRKVNVSPSTSCDLLPSSCTLASTSTVWSGPALATGREFCVVITTVSGALSSCPSLTMSCTTYIPGRSTTNVGFTTVGSESSAVLPAGGGVTAQRETHE